MTFLAPHQLWLVLPLAALVAAYVWVQLRRRHFAARFTNLDLLASIAPKRPGWRRHVAAGGMALALLAMVVGLAHPATDRKVPKEEATVMLVVDTSASMEAIDVTPSRLSAAIAAASSFVDDLPDGIQVGLVAFDGTARVVSAPTTDHDAVVAGIEQLTPGEGTAAGTAITTALEAISTSRADATAGSSSAAAVVLLSDGATTTGETVADATAGAVDADVPISTIAFGTPDGTVTVDGQTVPVPADTATLAEVASTTGGTAFTAASSDELRNVYADIGSRIGYRTVQQDIGMTFVGVALVLLLGSLAAALVWSGRVL
jgi:Ca-activated chloride channel family protein